MTAMKDSSWSFSVTAVQGGLVTTADAGVNRLLLLVMHLNVL